MRYTGETTRDTVQRILVGRQISVAQVPFERLLGRVRSRSRRFDLLDHIAVKHVSGGVSIIGLKSYVLDERFQGETLDRVWLVRAA